MLLHRVQISNYILPSLFLIGALVNLIPSDTNLFRSAQDTYADLKTSRCLVGALVASTTACIQIVFDCVWNILANTSVDGDIVPIPRREIFFVFVIIDLTILFHIIPDEGYILLNGLVCARDTFLSFTMLE